MQKATYSISLALILVSAFMANASSESFAMNEISEQNQFPQGKWSFSVHPYMGEGYESRPVVVTSVRTEAKNLSVTAVRVRNISSKPVAAVKFEWRLLNENAMNAVLQKGETPLVNVSGGLVSGEGKTLKLPIISFREIYKSLLQGQRLEGGFRVEVAVSEILFEDQSSWTVGQSVT